MGKAVARPGSQAKPGKAVARPGKFDSGRKIVKPEAFGKTRPGCEKEGV